MKRVVIREATTYDLPDLVNLWLAMGAERSFEDPDALGWFDQQFAGMQAGVVVVAGAFFEGRCVGFADGSLVYEPGTRETSLVGRHLFVEKGFRGANLSGTLMLRLLALARQSGASCYLTHGTPSIRATEKYLGKPMTDHAVVKVARW